MSNKIPKWHDARDNDLWLYEKCQKTDLQYAEAEILALRSELHNENKKDDFLTSKISDLESANTELSEALSDLVAVINAAKLHNLSRGVELGQTVWFVKASDAMNYADTILKKVGQTIQSESNAFPNQAI